MDVNPVHGAGHVPKDATPPGSGKGAGAAAKSEQAASQKPNEASSELAELIRKAQQSSEVREAKVREVEDRLASGYYLTADAAEKTARAIFDAP